MSGTQPDAASLITGRQWQRSTVLSDAVLHPLYELNWDFLTTMSRAPRYWRGSPAGTRLPDPVCAELITLDAARRLEVARCPFSLFSARFHDAHYWSELAVPAAVQEQAAVEIDAELRCLLDFAQPALFYAWHLVHANPAAARIVLGMTGQSLAIFRGLPLARLQRIAAERPDLLSPRWPDRPAFWHSLLAVVSTAASEERVDARLLGLQMLAADVAAAASRQAAPVSVRGAGGP